MTSVLDVATDVVERETEGGGFSGRGPGDDDDRWRRPERPDDDARRLRIVLAILALGAGVLSARILARRRATL